MTVLTIEVPDEVYTLIRELARVSGCPPSFYAGLCCTSGLAEQVRYHGGPTGKKLANHLRDLLKAMTEDQGVELLQVTLPAEVSAIMDYEVQKASG
jgi:hypothetical protein